MFINVGNRWVESAGSMFERGEQRLYNVE